MTICTALTEQLGLTAPIILAPMAGVAGGALAAAVSCAGGLGLIGGGYGDPAWIEREWAAADGADIGIGFITWRLSENAAALPSALARKPRAVLLSFGDISPYAAQIKASGAVLIAQVQNIAEAHLAAAAGADILVAQGTEAGGHSGERATLPLVPALVDAVGDIPVVAAGGIADGRGLAAALMLGASGVLCGSAFYPTTESLAHHKAKTSAIAASGDDTIRHKIFDIMRGFDWPQPWELRTLGNDFIRNWQHRVDALPAALASEGPAFAEAVASGDTSIAPVIVGEAADLLHDITPAAEIVQCIAAEAEALLTAPKWLIR